MTILAVTTAILIIIEGRFQIFQMFPSSTLVLTTVKSRFANINYHENGVQKFKEFMVIVIHV